MRVRELAALLGSAFEGDGERQITSAAPLEAAGPNELSFVGNLKAAQLARTSAAGCLIVPPTFESEENQTLIRVEQPRTAFAAALSHLYSSPALSGIDPAATLGEDVQVGSGTYIAAGCVIGDHVEIGSGCVLHPNVTIYDNVKIGDRVVLHAGCVLGADGFGFVLTGERYQKFPQVGRVVIEDDVEIGANSCVDRAALGETVIGQGTKLDNLVHIGHNCRIGRHVVIAAQTGLSGGVTIEDYAVIGGQVGIGDKARIEAHAVIGSKGGVLPSKVVRAGEPLWGIPARPLREHLRQLANLARLPQLRAEMGELKRRLSALEEK